MSASRSIVALGGGSLRAVPGKRLESRVKHCQSFSRLSSVWHFLPHTAVRQVGAGASLETQTEAKTVETDSLAESSQESILYGTKLVELAVEGDFLESTTEHRVLVGGWIATATAVLVKGFGEAMPLSEACLLVLGACFCAYIAADFASGVYHWAIDNYGSAKTPIFGNQIEGFQGHHRQPWTISMRQFCNNVHGIAKPAIFYMLPALFLPSNTFWDAFCAFSASFVVLSQQFHSWSHSRKEQLPEIVIRLQDWGVLISRKQHAQHHCEPFENNYCIVSGWWNGPLDSSGVFTWAERLIHRLTGNRPRCWNSDGV